MKLYTAIIVIALCSPLSLMKHFIQKDTNEKSQYNTYKISFMFGLLGGFLLLGGLIYSFTENSGYLVLSFMVPVLFIEIKRRFGKKE